MSGSTPPLYPPRPLAAPAAPPNAQLRLRLGQRATTLPQTVQDAQVVRIIAEAFDRQTGAKVPLDGVSFEVRSPAYGALLDFQPGFTFRLSPYAIGIDIEMDAAGHWRVRAECLVPNRSADEVSVEVKTSGMGFLPDGPILTDEHGQPLAGPTGGLLRVQRLDRLEAAPPGAVPPEAIMPAAVGGQAVGLTVGALGDAVTAATQPGIIENAEAAVRPFAEAAALSEEIAANAADLSREERIAAAQARGDADEAKRLAVQAGEDAAVSQEAAALSEEIASGAADIARDERIAAEAAKTLAEQQATTAAAEAARAIAAADSAVAGALSPVVQRETLAQLSAAAGVEGQVGEVYGLNADRGRYRFKGAAWVRESDTLPQVQARVDAIPVGTSDANNGLMAEFVDGEGNRFAGIDQDGRRLFAAGQRWTQEAGGVSRWSGASGQPSVALTPSGIATDGTVARVGAVAIEQSAASLPDGLVDHARVEDEGGHVAFRVGDRHMDGAGMSVRRGAAEWTLAGPGGAVLRQAAGDGAPTLPGRLELMDVPGALMVIGWADGDYTALEAEAATGLVRLQGRAGSAAIKAAADFTAAELSAFQGEAATYSDKVARRDVSGLVQPQAGLVAWPVYGQSLGNGWEAWPALSKSGLPSGLRMIGESVHPTSEADAAWTQIGAAALNPLVANVVTTSASARTVMTDAAVAALAAGATNIGETPLIAAIAALRAAWLRARGSVADPASQWVLGTCGVGGRTVAQLSKGASPAIYNRYLGFLAACKAQGDAQNLPTMLGGIVYVQGENDYTTSSPPATSFADYVARLTQLIADMRADAAATLPAQPGGIIPVYLVQTGASYARDGEQLAVARAQIEVARTVPGVFIACNAQPFPDKSGHLTSNGSRWMGAQIGKAMARTLVAGLGFECTRPLRFVVRGRTVVGIFHTPSGALAFGQPYAARAVASAASSASRGLYLEDSAGAVPIAGAEVAGRLVLWTIGRDRSGPMTAWLGRKAGTDGTIVVADTDETPLAFPYVYAGGTGQYADENLSELAALRYPSANYSLADVQTVAAI